MFLGVPRFISFHQAQDRFSYALWVGDHFEMKMRNGTGCLNHNIAVV
jgi:hypothetical protein